MDDIVWALYAVTWIASGATIWAAVDTRRTLHRVEKIHRSQGVR